jgi:ATP-dependent Clp protease ATP-binding subunit ClpA
MIGIGPWMTRLLIVMFLISVNYASPPLAAALVGGAAIAATGIFLFRGRYLPKFVMLILDRLTDRSALEKAYEQRSQRLATIDAEDVARRVKARVIGQDHAADAMVGQLRRRIAARRKDKPLAVFCLAGCPGVGKTHFAKVLAEQLYGDRGHLHFFDMSQFAQAHAAASLFGQARGYVGSTSYGALTAALRDVPDAIVLLDEFEKADPEVHQRFLTAWNDGFVTEVSDGARVPTNEAVFILTTNAASLRISEIAAEGTDSEEVGRLAKAVLADAQFAPEVLSRIDEVFAFRPLKGLDITRVVALEIEGLARQFGLEIADGGIDPQILLSAVETLSQRMQGGVRDISRALEREITDSLIDVRASGSKRIRLISEGPIIKVSPADEHAPSTLAAPAVAA